MMLLRRRTAAYLERTPQGAELLVKSVRRRLEAQGYDNVCRGAAAILVIIMVMVVNNNCIASIPSISSSTSAADVGTSSNNNTRATTMLILRLILRLIVIRIPAPVPRLWFRNGISSSSSSSSSKLPHLVPQRIQIPCQGLPVIRGRRASRDIWA